MPVSWDHTRQLLRAGEYEQAALSLEQVRHHYTQTGNVTYAHLLSITRHLCLMCLECYLTTSYHQQALVSMADHLDGLSELLT
jgi:hypothetical protein